MRLLKYFKRRSRPKTLTDDSASPVSASMGLGQGTLSLHLGEGDDGERYTVELGRREALVLAKRMLGYLMESERPLMERSYRFDGRQPEVWATGRSDILRAIDLWFDQHGGAGQFGTAREETHRDA